MANKKIVLYIFVAFVVGTFIIFFIQVARDIGLVTAPVRNIPKAETADKRPADSKGTFAAPGIANLIKELPKSENKIILGDWSVINPAAQNKLVVLLDRKIADMKAQLAADPENGSLKQLCASLEAVRNIALNNFKKETDKKETSPTEK